MTFTAIHIFTSVSILTISACVPPGFGGHAYNTEPMSVSPGPRTPRYEEKLGEALALAWTPEVVGRLTETFHGGYLAGRADGLGFAYLVLYKKKRNACLEAVAKVNTAPVEQMRDFIDKVCRPLGEKFKDAYSPGSTGKAYANGRLRVTQSVAGVDYDITKIVLTVFDIGYAAGDRDVQEETLAPDRTRQDLMNDCAGVFTVFPIENWQTLCFDVVNNNL